MNRILVFVFSLFLALSLVTQALPDITFSEQENRYLQTMPKLTWSSLVSGRFTSSFETYIQDHFIWRDGWIKVKTGLEQLLGKEESGGVYLGKEGWYFETETSLDETQLNKNIELLDGFSSWLIDQGILVSFVPIYSSYMFYEELLPQAHLNIDQKEITMKLQAALDLDVIDSFDQLMKHKQEDIYFRTDHHWTQLGAYYAYQTIAAQLGWDISELRDCEVKKADQQFFGTLYTKAPRFGQHGDDFAYYVPADEGIIRLIPEANIESSSYYDVSFLDKKDKYSAFLGGNYGTVILRHKDLLEDDDDIRRLVVFKDSYSHALAPFLAQHYDEVILIDMRYFQGDIRTYINELEPDYVMFAYHVKRFADDKNLIRWKH